MASIYGLYDSSGALRYIGKADDSGARLKSHMRDALRRDTPLYRWIRKNGLPEMRTLVADCEDWKVAERKLIREARECGERLLNVAEGGDEPHCSKAQRRANATALNRRLADDPKAMALRHMKRSIMTMARMGHLSDERREDYRMLAEVRPDIFGCFAKL